MAENLEICHNSDIVQKDSSMESPSVLTFDPSRAAILIPPYAGLFACPGTGRHVRRVIQSHELIFVVSGALHIAEEGEEFVVHSDQVLMLRAGREHYGTRPYPSDLKMFWINFSLPTGKATRRQPHVGLPRLTTLSQPDELTELFLYLLRGRAFSATGDPPPSTKGRQQLADTWPAGDLERAAVGLGVTQMLCLVARAAQSSGQLPAETPGLALAQKAAQFIASHARSAISTASVAEALDCNPDYLSRTFRKVHGYTLTDAIHRRRIYEAKMLLVEEPMTIEQIACTCGFGGAKYMGILFRRYLGMSPMAYRQSFTIPSSSIVTV
jgi:AraC-like DNA-binding protein